MLTIGKSSSWEAGLEDGVCQTSPVFSTMFYVACVCEGRFIRINDQLQMSRKLLDSDVILATSITDNAVYFQAVHKGRLLC